MEALTLWLVLATALLLGVPVAFSLALSAFAILLLFTEGLSPQAILTLMAQRMFVGADSFPLLAVPLFFLAGAIMEEAGISERLVKLAVALVGWIRGGLSMVAVVAEMFLSGITGSASADAAAIGSVMIPALKRRGYHLAFAAALVAAAGALGPIIPPSILMVIYGSLADVSVGRLFIGGAIPGVMFGVGLMTVCYFVAKRRQYPREPALGARAGLQALNAALIPLGAPILILGGIFAGIFTATESAMIAVAYALLVGKYVYRTVSWARMVDLCYESAVGSARVMFIIAVASFVGWVLARERVPQAISGQLLSLSDNPFVALLIIHALLLLFGCFLEATAILIILMPTLLPVITALKIDPVFFGVTVIINLAIGTVTPPVGTCLFVTSAISQLPMDKVVAEAWKFLLVMVAILVVILAVPQTVLWLPSLVF